MPPKENLAAHEFPKLLDFQPPGFSFCGAYWKVFVPVIISEIRNLSENLELPRLISECALKGIRETKNVPRPEFDQVTVAVPAIVHSFNCFLPFFQCLREPGFSDVF